LLQALFRVSRGSKASIQAKDLRGQALGGRLSALKVRSAEETGVYQGLADLTYSCTYVNNIFHDLICDPCQAASVPQR